MFDEEMIGEGNSLLVYGSYANGFRSGGFNGRPATVTVAKPYNPETVDQYELGLKSSWGEARSLLTLPATILCTTTNKSPIRYRIWAPHRATHLPMETPARRASRASSSSYLRCL
jgi:hypothetical protein